MGQRVGRDLMRRVIRLVDLRAAHAAVDRSGGIDRPFRRIEAGI